MRRMMWINERYAVSWRAIDTYLLTVGAQRLSDTSKVDMGLRGVL